MARQMNMFLLWCLIAVMDQVSYAAEYNVGDSLGWGVPPNLNYYSEWARNKKFSIGDKLIFNWTGTHTVGIVSKYDYDNCVTEIGRISGPVFTGPSGTKFQVTLDQTGPHYYICTVGNHCTTGQKLSIDVESSDSGVISPSAQSPLPDSSASALSLGLLSLLLSAIAVYLFAC